MVVVVAKNFTTFLGRSAYLTLLAINLCVGLAFADQPLEAPADKLIYSNNKQFVAFMDYKGKNTTVYRISKQGKREEQTKLWEMPGWFYSAALADDGEHLVVGYHKRNLLDLNYKQDEVMLTFYRRGVEINRVTLNQLLEDPRPQSLQRTASHYAWRNFEGFNGDGHYVVSTKENRDFIFDVTTGQPINIPLFSADRTDKAKAPDNLKLVANEANSTADAQSSARGGSVIWLPIAACVACIGALLYRVAR